MNKKFLSIYSNQNMLFAISFFVIFLYYFPFIFFGEDSQILIHDNLDSNVTNVKILFNSGEILASPDKPILQVFNGLPRSSIQGTYDFSLIWFKFFGIYWGYIFNKVLISLIGFIGMYYLLKKHFLPNHVFIIIPIGVSLLFALLPFWFFNISVSGLPLIFYAFLNIRKGDKHLVNWLILVLFPFYSSLFLTGIYFIILILIILIFDIIKTSKINITFLLGILIFSSLYIFSHFPLFYSFFISTDFVSHRIEFDLKTFNFEGVIREAAKLFLFGKYHAHSLHTFILLPIGYAVFQQLIQKKINQKYLYLLIFIIVTSFLFSFKSWHPIAPLTTQIITIVPLKIERFHFLHPMFWYILLSISLYMISRYLRFGKQIVLLLLLLQLIYILRSHEFYTERNKPTFRQFYAKEQFEEIKSFITKPLSSYRVISIGIHPSIAQFNGFYTLDGYFSLYPLKYKHEFRKVIIKELDKDNSLKEYYDRWGSRCYAFSSELGRDYLNPNPKKIEHLEFNYKVLKEMGGKYILSYTEINTINNVDIKFLKLFENSNSYWQIYLYEIL